MFEPNSSEWLRAKLEKKFEGLLALFDDEIPEDFVPLDDATMATRPRRPARLEISVTQHLSSPDAPIDPRDPGLVNRVIIKIYPQTVRSQARQEREWTELCRSRESIRAFLAGLRRGRQECVSAGRLLDQLPLLNARPAPPELSQ